MRIDGAEASFHLDAAAERLIIEAPLDTGDAVIDITFTGTLNDKLRGWYRSTFNDSTVHQRVIATTQMQATDCRRAFPCFDEPDFKAVFEITLVDRAGSAGRVQRSGDQPLDPRRRKGSRRRSSRR